MQSGKLMHFVASSGSRNVQLQIGFQFVSNCWFIKDCELIIIRRMPQITVLIVSTITISFLMSIKYLYRKLTSCHFKLRVHCSQHTRIT